MKQINSEWHISSYRHVKHIPEEIEGRKSYAWQILPAQGSNVANKFIDSDKNYVEKSLINIKIEVDSDEQMMEFLRQNKVAWNGSVYSNISNTITYADGNGLHLFKVFSYNDKGEIIKVS